MPRVCILTTVHPPFDTRIFHKQAKTLKRAGYNVVLIAQHNEPTTVDDINLIALPRPRNRLTRLFGLSGQAFRLAFRQKAEIYHFHDPELIPVGLALKALTRARVIYDIHEDYPQQILSKAWIPPALRRPIALGMAALERVAAWTLDGLVAATPTIARRFPSAKTIVVRNFPQLSELTPASSNVPYTARPPLAVYIGRITTIRSASEIVAAIGQIEGNAELTLAGAFESPALKKRLTQLAGWQRTHFAGWLNRPQVAALLGQARVGLVLFYPEPNHLNALPNKIFEYMAAGIPFVASDFPLWREIGEGAGLFVDPRDPHAIAQAIQWLLEHPAEAQAMGERGRALVEREYNWAREAEKLLHLYQRLLS